MSKFFRVLTAVLVAIGLTLVAGTAANAAPTKKGYTEVTSPLLNLAPLLGVQVSATGPATKTDTGLQYPLVGNTEVTGVMKNVGGTMLSKADGTVLLTLTNSHHNLTTGVVTMVVNDGDRVDTFTATENTDGSYTLKFTEHGAQAIADALGLPLIPGLLSEGATFGTSTTVLP